MPRVIALITYFNPTRENIENTNIIAKQVDKVFIFDNSSYSSIKHNYFKSSNIKYYTLGKNYGLSGAFNFLLKNENFKWYDDDFIIFFDQDTKIKLQHIEILKNEYIHLLEDGYNVGCIGPFFFNNSNNKIEVPKLKKRVNTKTFNVKSVITSSMLTQYSTLVKVNFWNENIFLDLTDWDLCWRLEKLGKKCFMTKETIINHSVGEGEKKILFFHLRIGKPFREYYQTRDCLYLLKEGYVPIRFKCRFILNVTVRPILHIVFLDNKKERYKFIKKGFVDFMHKKTGPL